jgi:hypothetical protein
VHVHDDDFGQVLNSDLSHYSAILDIEFEAALVGDRFFECDFFMD